MKGNIILVFGAMIWGSGFIAQKLGNNVMPPVSFTSTRMIMAAVVLMPVLVVNLRKNGYLSKEKNSEAQLEYKRSRMIKAGFVCGLLMVLATSLQQIGLVTVSVGKSGFITAIYIVFVPILSVVIGKKVKLRAFGCALLALAGFAVMSLKGGLGNATPGDWLTLASAFTYSAQIVAINQFVDKDNDILLSVLQMAVGGIAGLIVAVSVEHPALSSFTAALPILLYSTFVPTALGYTLQIIGQKYTDASTAALIMSLESVFALIFGAIFFGEVMSVRELLGSAIIFTAIILGQIEPVSKE